MSPLDFLRLIVPEASAYYSQTIHPTETRRHYSLEAMHDSILADDARGVATYYAMAGFHEMQSHVAPGRTQENVWVVKSLWGDIDVDKPDEKKDYRTVNDAVMAVHAFCVATGLPMPLIVCSGWGVHIYWPFRVGLLRERWQRMAWKLKAIYHHAGLKTDDTCTADSARILRMPGTTNRKYRTQPKPVFAQQRPYTPHDPDVIEAKLDTYIELHHVAVLTESKSGSANVNFSGFGEMPDIGTDVNDDLSAGVYKEYSIIPIEQEDGCGIVNWFMRNGGTAENGGQGMSDATYHTAMYPLFSHSLENDPEHTAFHNRAAQYTNKKRGQGYSKSRTEYRGRTLKGGPPNSCAKFRNNDTEHAICMACPHRDIAGGPKSLGIEQAQPLPEEETDDTIAGMQADQEAEHGGNDVKQPDFLGVHGFTHTAFGTYKLMGKDTAPKPLSKYHCVGVDALRGTTSLGLTYVFHMQAAPKVLGIGPDQRIIDVNVPASAMAKSTGEVELAFLNRRVNFMPIQGKREVFMSYLKAWLDDTLYKKEGTLAEQFGRQPDGSIVHGAYRYSKGLREPALLSSQMEKMARHMAPTGDEILERCAIKTLCDGSLPKHFANLLGIGAQLGSLFMVIDGIYGGTLNFYTPESGNGKSSRGFVGLALLGDPRQLHVKGTRASVTFMDNHCKLLNSFGVMVDEITHMTGDQASTLVNQMSGGGTAQRANTDQSNRDSYDWSFIAVTTANASLSHMCATTKINSDGDQMRALDVNVALGLVDPTSPEGTAVDDIYRNHGYTYPRYLEYVTRDWEKAQASVRPVFHELMKRYAQNGGAERVWWAMLAAILTGLRYAEAAGCFDFKINYTAFVEYYITHVRAGRAVMQNRSTTPLQRLQDVVTRVMMTEAAMVVTEKPNDSSKRLPYGIDAKQTELRKPPTARYNVYDGVLVMLQADLRRMLDPMPDAPLSAGREAAVLSLNNTPSNLWAGVNNMPMQKGRFVQIDTHKLAEMLGGTHEDNVTELYPHQK